MSASSLTSPSLKGQRLWFILSGVTVLAAFLIFVPSLISIHIDFRDMELNLISFLNIPIDSDYYYSYQPDAFISLLSLPLVWIGDYGFSFLSLAFPTLMLMQYILYGYKMRFGSLIMATSMLTLPTFFLCKYSDWLLYGYGFITFLIFAITALGFLTGVAATMVYLFVPGKGGKLTGAILFAVGMLTVYLGDFLSLAYSLLSSVSYGITSDWFFGATLSGVSFQCCAVLTVIVLLMSNGIPLIQKKDSP